MLPWKYDCDKNAIFEYMKVIDIKEKNFKLATVIKINPKTVKIRFEDNREIKNCLSKNLQRLDEILNDFIFDIEHAIAKYDNELKHTINGKKEYVFKEDEFVGESKLKFSSQAKEVIEKNQEAYKQFVISLNIKFPHISIVESSNTLLHYKFRGVKNV